MELSKGHHEQSNVRDLIFAYERQSSFIEPLEESHPRPRAKSIGNALSYKLFREPKLEINSIIDIEKELVKIEAHLNYYEIYDKETHVAFQEQLFNILTEIVRIDSQGDQDIRQKKKALIGDTQKLAQVLNSKLPFDGVNKYTGPRRVYSNVVRKDEAVVTTTVKTRAHKAVLSTQNSTLNGYKSEDSLSSLDSSARHDESLLDVTKNEERSNSATPPNPQKNIVDEADSGGIPSVSKLRQFFSFIRGQKSSESPDVHVSSASYSGLHRSKSLNWKTKYSVSKNGRKVMDNQREKEEVIRENDEDGDNDSIGNEEGSNEKHLNRELDSPDPDIYVEPAKDIVENREVQDESKDNVSVTKLKRLFEEKNMETSQGNYMNFTGLLRNVDITKTNEMSKSKSLSDLKSEDIRYQLRDIDIDQDKSHNLEDNVENVSISFGEKNSDDITNSVENDNLENKPDDIKGKADDVQQINSNNEIQSVSGTVETLKRTFEDLSEGKIEVNKNEEINSSYIKKEPSKLDISIYSSFDNDNTENEEPFIKTEENAKTQGQVNDEASRKISIFVNGVQDGSEAAVKKNCNSKNNNINPIASYETNELIKKEGNLEKDGTKANRRIEIENKTLGLMKILESPTSFSALLSSTSSSHQSEVSSSSLSVSSSSLEKTLHTSSTQVLSQRVVSSSSLHQNESYAQVLEEPVSYSILTHSTPQENAEKSSVTITEIKDDPNVNSLNTTQDDIIEEILKDVDTIANVDEEFEKLLKESI